MRNRKVCLLFAMVLVVAMVCGLVMGCTPDSDGPEDQGGLTFGNNGGGNSGNVEILDSADVFITFDVISTTNPESLVSIKNMVTGESIAPDVKLVPGSKDLYRVYPPIGGYETGDTYVIEVGKGVSFAKYPGKNAVEFTINTNVVADLKLNNGVKEFPSTVVSTWGTERTDKYGNVFGSMTLQTNDEVIKAGEVFIIEDVATGTKKAYKVTEVMSATNANVMLNYTKPDIDEVYDEFEYAGKQPLNEESDVEFYDSDTQYEVLDNSDLALALASFFGEKPKFNVGVNKVGDKIAATVTITIPNVVKLDNGTSTDLVLSVENLLSAVADTAMFKKDAELEFDVSALITNEITCKASIATHASFDEIVNVRQLIDKLTEVAQESAGDDAVSVPLFKWILPIANGAAQISYQADLAFRFAFAGSFDVVAKTTLQYNVGASYSKADGINTYAQEIKRENGPFDSVAIKLQGNATIKVGVIQEVRFDVLSGVLGLGIQAELGNYNRLYGYFQTDNLLGEEVGAVGNLYFTGGFYYDVDLKFGIKIGSLINLVDQKVDITAGEKELYNLGEKELILSINEKQTYALQAFTNVMPTYTMQVYDMVSGTISTKDIPTDLIQYTVTENASKVTIDKANNTISVANRNSKFSDVVVKVSIDGADATPITTTFSYTGAVVLEQSNYTYDKSASNDQVVITAKIGGEVIGTPVAKVGDTEIGTAVPTSESGVYTITLNTTELDKLSNGVNNVTIVAGSYSAVAKVEISGKVSVYANPVDGVAGAYFIYTADQINDMIDRNLEYAGKTFILKNDINMNGAEIGQISKFAGTLNGAGYKIYNYTVKSFKNNVAAFIGENAGNITDITFAGDVIVDLKAATNSNYIVAGVVGKNATNAKLTNVVFAGNVNVKSTGLQAFVKVDVAGIAGQNAGTMDGCDVANGATINATFTFDLANVTFNVGGITATVADDDVTPTYKCTAGKDGKGVFTTVNVAK
ncbi:MAG: hypothetical protein SO434_02000 [Eubacteriales bacterium]|nr:hypothetical protein [Eubacteriales bacterium]